MLSGYDSMKTLDALKICWEFSLERWPVVLSEQFRIFVEQARLEPS